MATVHRRRFATLIAIGGLLTAAMTLGGASLALANHQWNSYHWLKENAGALSLTVSDNHGINPSIVDWSTLLNTGGLGEVDFVPYDSDGVAPSEIPSDEISLGMPEVDVDPETGETHRLPDALAQGLGLDSPGGSGEFKVPGEMGVEAFSGLPLIR